MCSVIKKTQCAIWQLYKETHVYITSSKIFQKHLHNSRFFLDVGKYKIYIAVVNINK